MAKKRRLRPEFKQPGLATLSSRRVRRAYRNLVERIEDIPEGESLLIMVQLKRHPRQTTPNYLKKGPSIEIPSPTTQTVAIDWQTYGVPFLRGKPKEAIPLRLRAHAFNRLSQTGMPRDLARIVLCEPQWGKIRRHKRILTPNETLEGQRIFALAHQKEEDISAYVYCDPSMAPEAGTKGGKAIVQMRSRYVNERDIKFTRRHLPVIDNEFKLAIALQYETTNQSGFEFNFLGFASSGDPTTQDWMIVSRYEVAGELAIIKRAKEMSLLNSSSHPVPLEMTLFPIFNQGHIDFYKRLLDSVLVWDPIEGKPRKPHYAETVKLNFERMVKKGYYSTAFTKGRSGRIEDQDWSLRRD